MDEWLDDVGRMDGWIHGFTLWIYIDLKLRVVYSPVPSCEWYVLNMATDACSICSCMR